MSVTVLEEKIDRAVLYGLWDTCRQAVFLTVGLYDKFDEIYSVLARASVSVCVCVCVCVFVNRDSAVGIATGSGLDGPGIEFRWV